MKQAHIQLIGLLIDFLSIDSSKATDLHEYLLDHGVRYPERSLDELRRAIQERMYVQG